MSNRTIDSPCNECGKIRTVRLKNFKPLCIVCSNRARCVPIADRFWSKVNKNGIVLRHELGPCWVWTAGAMHFGHGAFWINGKQEAAHRVAFFFAYGRWPDPCALHRCDNPSCVKALPDAFGPAHLFEGTQSDNIFDRDAKHRNSYGERVNTAVLTEADVIMILSDSRSGGQLARVLGVTSSTIYAIRSGRSWRHIPR